MRYYILVEGDSIMTQKRVAVVQDGLVNNIIIVNEEDLETLKSDVESSLGGELIDATDWVDTDTETPIGQVSPGFTYSNGIFVKPEPTPNTITEEDIARSLAKFAADVARGDNPDYNSLPEGATGPREENN
jgi:hypothetical protein